MLGVYLFNPIVANAQIDYSTIKQEISSNLDKDSSVAVYDIRNKLHESLKKETDNNVKAQIAELLMLYNLQELLYMPKSVNANWRIFRNKEYIWYRSLWAYSKYLKYLDNEQNEQMSSAFLQSISDLEKQNKFKNYKVLDLYASYALTYLKYCPNKETFDNIDKYLIKIVTEYQYPKKGVYTLELYKDIAKYLRNK